MRRVGRIAGGLAVTIAVLLAICIGGAVLYARSEHGGALIARKLCAFLDEKTNAHFVIERVDASLWGYVTLRGVRIYGSDGQLAARARELRVESTLARRNRLHVHRMLVLDPEGHAATVRRRARRSARACATSCGSASGRFASTPSPSSTRKRRCARPSRRSRSIACSCASTW